MSSPDRRAARWPRIALALVAVLALAPAGCGFRPLHGEAQEADTPGELAQVQIGPLYDRRGQILRNMLLTAITPKGEVDKPRYLLSVRFSDSVTELAIGRDQFATRGNLRLQLGFTLIDQVTQKPLYAGAEVRIAAFNILRSEYATEAARDDAFQRAAEGVAQDVRTQLAVFFIDRRNKPQAATPP